MYFVQKINWNPNTGFQPPGPRLPPHLREAMQGGVQAGVHARGRLVGDLDGVLQDASGDDMLLWARRRLSAHKHPVVWVTVQRCALQQGLQSGQPASHQVHVLTKHKRQVRPLTNRNRPLKVKHNADAGEYCFIKP